MTTRPGETVLELLRRYLTPPVPWEDGHFLHVSRAVPVGHVLEHNGEQWQCVWCQPAKPGFLALLMAIKNPGVRVPGPETGV